MMFQSYPKYMVLISTHVILTLYLTLSNAARLPTHIEPKTHFSRKLLSDTNITDTDSKTHAPTAFPTTQETTTEDQSTCLPEPYNFDPMYQNCRAMCTPETCGLPRQATPMKICSCDVDCKIHDDCCPNFPDVCPGEFAKETILPEDSAVCVATPLRAYSFIAKCSNDWVDETIRELCEVPELSPYGRIPVTDKATNISFLNFYCAKCHSVNPDDFIIWTPEVKCFDDYPNATSSGLLMLVNTGKCNLLLHSPPGYPTRRCDIVVDSCDEMCKDEDLRQKCKAGPNVPHFNLEFDSGIGDYVVVRYRNLHCAICNGVGPNCLIEPFGSLPRLGDFSFAIVMDFNRDGCVSLGQNENKHIDCDYEKISQDWVYTTNTTGNCTTNETICFNETVPNSGVIQPTAGYKNWLGVLSLICTGASIIAISIRIALQCCVPVFNNMAGKVQFSLVLALLLGLLAFMIGPILVNNFYICAFTGCVMHWAFLSAFIWMNVVAVDMMKVFNGKLRSAQNSARIFSLYSLYAWLTSTAVVSIALSLDIAGTNTPIRPYYGRGSCWIASNYALLTFFGLPIAVIVIVNIVLYIITAVTLHRSMKSTSKVMESKRSDTYHFGIYVKLFILMGATWLIGFIAAYVKHDIVWACFIILNGSQGLFISASSVCTRQVYKGLFERRSSSYASKSTNSSFYSNTKQASQKKHPDMNKY